MNRLQKGFTLIELMIVIAIIAILAAILIPNFLHARAQSQSASCQGNEKQLATALEEYAVDHNGTYPATFAALITPGRRPSRPARISRCSRRIRRAACLYPGRAGSGTVHRT